MSDDEYDMMYSDDDAGSGEAKSGGGSGDGSQPDPEAELENKYFEAKEAYEEKKEKGLKAFQEVLDLAVKNGESTDVEKPWGFKALKRIIKINHELNRPEEVKKQYARMLKDYLPVLVSQEKALNNLLDALSDSKVIKDLYDMTLEAFEKKGNKKACLRLELRLAKVLFQKKDFETLEKVSVLRV
jgi:COP9 signalosome complex subunit 2